MSNTNQLIDVWKRRAFVGSKAHYKSAVKLDRNHWAVGLFVVCLNAIVGSAVFATLVSQSNLFWIKVIAGCFSLITAVLAGIQTFRRDNERAEKHRVSAAKFNEMLRELELIEVTGHSSDDLNKVLVEFNKRYVQLVKESPVPDENIFSEIRKLHLAPFEVIENNNPSSAAVPLSN
jgi:hypothetical protein